MADAEEVEDGGVAATLAMSLAESQLRVFKAVELEAAGDEEAQTSLMDLHKACKDIIGIPQVLLATQSGDDGVYDTSLPVSELPTPTAADARVDALKELARAPLLEAAPLEAEVLKAQLSFVADPERFWAHQCEIIEHFFLTRQHVLQSQRQQVLCRWLRFCSTSETKEDARRDFEGTLAAVDASLVAATERTGRMQQHPALDDKRLASRDLIEFHRHAALNNRLHTRVRRLMKTLDWTTHRSGGELLLKAKTQIRDSADEAYEREGTIHDGVPLMTAEAEDLDNQLRALIEEFGVEEADADVDPPLDGELEDVAEVEPVAEGEGAEQEEQEATDGRTVDLLDESREGDLLSMVKAVFMRVHREQTPQLRFPPYGSAVAQGGQDPAVLTKQKEAAGGAIEGQDSDQTAGTTHDVDTGPIDMSTVHLKAWVAPTGTDRTPASGAPADCEDDVAREVRENMAASLAQVENVDARLLGEAQYIHEPSCHHAQNRVREAAERHGNIAQVLKGVIDPPSLEENQELGAIVEDMELAPIMSTAKLQAYYYLRAIQVREAKRRILMNLNFFRSVQRTLAGEAEMAASGGDFDIHHVSATYDTYFCTDDGLPCVQDLTGVKVVYDKAVEDCDYLCAHLLKLATHHIAINREAFGEQSESKSDALFYVDTVAVLSDLLCSEAAYQDAKRSSVETYFEALQHVFVPAERAELSAQMLSCMAMRPKLNMANPYFTEGYSAEVVVCNLQSSLLRRVVSDQIQRERMLNVPEEPSYTGLMDVTLVPCGEATAIFEFYPSLGNVGKITKMLDDVVARTIRSFSLGRPDLIFDATLLTALESAVVQEAMIDWQLLEQQELIAQSSVHIRAPDEQEAHDGHMELTPGGSHSLEDPVLIDNTDALEMIIAEMRAELHGAKKALGADRIERETREIWVNALHVFCLRNDLLRGVFETNVLAAAYETQLQGFRLGARSSVEELKAARGEVSSLAVDYLPNLAISEFDSSFCAPDLQTRHGMKRLLSTHGIYQIRVATQLQLAHRSLLAVTVDYNHGAVCQLVLPSIMEAGGSDEPVDESKDKKLKECFLSIHRFKGALKDRLLKDYSLKSKNETSVQRCQQIMYGLMEDYCSWMLERSRGFSMVAQVCAEVQHVRWLARKFKPDGEGVFNVTFTTKELAEGEAEEEEVPVGEEAKKKLEEEKAARAPTRTAADIGDMSKFFAIEGPSYDLWCLPEHYSIMAVPEKDRSAGPIHTEEGINLRYFTVASLATMLRALYLRHSLATTAEQVIADGSAVTKSVAEDMRGLRHESSQLGSGATPTEVAQYVVNRSTSVWLTQLHAATEWRGTLERRRREGACAAVDRALSCRGCISMQPYVYGSYSEWPGTIPTHLGQRVCQQLVMEKQLFGSDGITTRGMLQKDQLTHIIAIVGELEPVDRAAFGEVLPKTAKVVLDAAAAQGVKPVQAAKFCEAALDFTTIHTAFDQLRVAFMQKTTNRDPVAAYEDAVIRGTKVSGPGTPGPAELLLAYIVKASKAIAMQGLRSEAQSMRQSFSMLSGHAVEDIPGNTRWPGAEERFKDKVNLVSKTMEELKGVAEFMVNEDGEQTVILTESDLEGKMDGLARELRKWSEDQIATVRSTERSDAAHIEHLLHIQEHKTKYTDHAMSLLKKSFARRVEAEIIDRNYQQLLDNDRLRRALHLQNEETEQQEPIIRKKVRLEYNDLVGELTMKLAASKARFREFHVQMTQDTLHSLTEVKRDTIKGMAEHKITPSGFKSRAPAEISTLTNVAASHEDETASQRAILKIKGLYHLKEINMKMKLRAMMDELETQEQKRKEAVGDGREQLEEKVMMQEEQLAETRALLNTTEIELKSCREELAMTHRSKHKLVQWKMGAKKRLSELESAGADADAAQRHFDKMKAEQDKTMSELEALSGIEQRAEQRNAVVELKTAKQLQRMKTTLRKEQRLKLQAYSRLEEVISDVSLGQSAVRHVEADVWLGKYQVRLPPLILHPGLHAVVDANMSAVLCFFVLPQASRRALEKSLKDNELLMNTLRANGIPVRAPTLPLPLHWMLC